jgi:hypothetical protein
MGWGLGNYEGRDVGYGVPAWCDHPACNAEIDRGLAHVCGNMHGGDGRGCGLYFCSAHLLLVDDPDSDGMSQLCERCVELDEDGQAIEAFPAKPDHPEWIAWKLTSESWAWWRGENPEAVAALRAVLNGQ